MIAILRDECSGICFRDLHGFCSTGSQISLLSCAPSGSVGGSTEAVPPGGIHLFTSASDPVIAAYKRFEFGSSVVSGSDEQGHGSLDLWRAHRELALRRTSPPCLKAFESKVLQSLEQ